MLSRGGGAVAFQKVVSKVSDLPSPLDAEPGSRIIVRETEEVYGLNHTTRMWEPIGTLKKVGGKSPEELGRHVDTEGNPHKTTLQDVLAAGQQASVDGEILITGKGASQIRLLSGTSALRVGPDVGNKDGVFWINAGPGRTTILRVVNSDGADQVVLGSDGSLTSKGVARFEGGFKGPAHFEDAITAAEGVNSAEGYDLVLSGDKGVMLRVGGQERALFLDDGLALRGNLSVKDLSLTGQVHGSIIPSKPDLKLGDPNARWLAAFVGSINVGGQVMVKVPANSKDHPFQIVSDVPGDSVVLTAGGSLGLGTDSPEARLDVRGRVLVDGGLALTGSGLASSGWSVQFADTLTIAHNGMPAITAGADGTVLSSNTKIAGDLVVVGKLALGSLYGLKHEEIEFKGGSATYRASMHKFTGPIKVDTTEPRPLDVPGLTVDNGNLLGQGDIKGWKSAQLDESLVVGTTTIVNGTIDAPDGLTVRGPRLVADTLHLRNGLIKSHALRLEGANGSAEFSMGGPTCGLTFEGKRWEVNGISQLTADDVSTKGLKVEGGAILCGGAANFSKQGLALTGVLSVGGLGFKRLEEDLELNGVQVATQFQLPVGVRIEAVVVKLKSDVSGARFLQVGDLATPDRFASPNTSLRTGSVIRGLNHCDRGQSVQLTEGPVVISCDAPATGKVHVTVYFVDPAAL